jgi:organic hydroperoxide reductase OsmC/OhrA
MKDFPHVYKISANAADDGSLKLCCAGLPDIAAAPPVEFDGPGDKWSPEVLLLGAIGGCFVLTFRAIARASKLTWTSLECTVQGTLDKVERQPQFTAFTIDAVLALPPEVKADRAQRMLEMAERTCLVTNSVKAKVELRARVEGA